jgi:hypothetical protein
MISNGTVLIIKILIVVKMDAGISFLYRIMVRRSQRPCGLRHELSSLAQTLGSCVRIPLEAWMSVCVYSVFVLFCV